MFVVIPGEAFGTRDDKIVMAGAHWDTVTNTPGYDDNASGVAAVLEVARALSMAACK